MFDTYRVQSGPSHISVHKTVEEKRAPTDESVRLLREMEQKAKDEVIKAIRLDNAIIDAVLHQRTNIEQATTDYVCIFKINGAKMTAEYTAKDWDEKEKAIFGLRDEIAKQVANSIMGPLIRSIERGWN